MLTDEGDAIQHDQRLRLVDILVTQDGHRYSADIHRLHRARLARILLYIEPRSLVFHILLECSGGETCYFIRIKRHREYGLIAENGIPFRRRYGYCCSIQSKAILCKAILMSGRFRKGVFNCSMEHASSKNRNCSHSVYG